MMKSNSTTIIPIVTTIVMAGLYAPNGNMGTIVLATFAVIGICILVNYLIRNWSSVKKLIANIFISMIIVCSILLLAQMQSMVRTLNIVVPYGFHGEVNIGFGCSGVEEAHKLDGVLTLIIPPSGVLSVPDRFPENAAIIISERSGILGEKALTIINQRTSEIRLANGHGNCETTSSFEVLLSF